VISFKQYISEEWETDVMSATEFISKIRENPSWCRTIKAPLTIQGEVDLEYGPITRLSPFLTFAGSVYLRETDHLKVLEGTFKNRVWASYSNIREVKGATISFKGGSMPYDTALGLSRCEKLEKVDAVVYGGVNLAWSSVTDISKLKVMKPSQSGWALDLTGCEKIETLSGHYVGAISINTGSNVKEIKDLTITEPNRSGVALYISRADIQKISNFTYNGKIDTDDKTLAKIQQLQGQEKAGGKGEFDGLF
jgi:hypothetical protein